MRVIFIFVVGVSLGYWVGFKDARMHSQDIVARMVQRAGGNTRDNVRADVDQEMRKVEQDTAR